jgi:hypothetical protein
MFEFDKSSKWLLGHHGDAILRLAGLPAPVAWRAVQAEVVQPRQLPDGLLEVQFAHSAAVELFVVEVATYPEKRLVEQLRDDLLLVFQDRRVLPEVLTLILHPKGTLRIPSSYTCRSGRGWSELHVRWRVIELWTVPAEPLLATGDPGVIPWVPLMAFSGPPEPVLRRCREVIDQQASSAERANLLAVTQVLTKLRYNDPALLALFGGRRIMIESPLIQEIVAEAQAKAKHESILTFLRARFGRVPRKLAAALRRIQDQRQLTELVALAARCPDLEAFQARLQS